MCTPFDVTVKDVKVALDKVKKAISGKGSFSGDEKKGSFSFSDSGIVAGKYAIKGSYTVDETTITISTDLQADRPIVTCKAVADSIREWLLK
jgi:carbon monoxide dehydrogenase subunit G